MILIQTNSGEEWTFDPDECRDFAWICACLPFDRMPKREAEFLSKMEAKFKRGANLTPKQWKWFAQLAERWKSWITGQEHVVEDIRALAAKCGAADA